jgi:dihydroneopterin aldolase
MTLMLASVTSAAEARTAVAAGADIIDLKDPQAGALGALPVETTRRAVAAVAGARPTSATVGDLPMEPASVRGAVEATAGTGVDYVKVGLFAGPGRLSCLAALAPLCARGIKVVIVIFADQQPDFSLIAPIARSGCAGVMVDTAHKGAGGLIRCLGPNQLKAFVRQARGAGLLTGLAGCLGLADIPKLLCLAPDYLGFRGALCLGSARTARLSHEAVAAVRAAIPEDRPQPSSTRISPRLSSTESPLQRL